MYAYIHGQVVAPHFQIFKRPRFAPNHRSNMYCTNARRSRDKQLKASFPSFSPDAHLNALLSVRQNDHCQFLIALLFVWFDAQTRTQRGGGKNYNIARLVNKP
jgi:hypothetical protein